MAGHQGLALDPLPDLEVLLESLLA